MKLTSKSNFRVVIEPRPLGHFGFAITSDSFGKRGTPEEISKQVEDDYNERCQEIVDQIKRHVDNIGYVNIEYDTQIICSHCHRDWDEDEDGIPCCCDMAQKEILDTKDETFRQNWSSKYGCCLP